MKRILALIITITLAVLTFGACSHESKPESKEASKPGDTSKTLNIVTTIFPEYDWVREILGDNVSNAELTLLMDNGVDLHSYQPSAEDITKIASCDIFIYVGGESDKWVEDALAEATNKDMTVINLLDVLGDKVKEEEIKEGMEGEEHDHDHDHDEDEDKNDDHDHEHHEEEPEYDEHVWLSLKNAGTICDKITEELCKKDQDNVKVYEANNKAYTDKLTKLDEEYKKTVDNAKNKTVIFGDRFPFRYLVDDYGLDYYAAFVGCSAETEASFETIVFLAEKVDETSVKTILTIENTDKKIAETIKENTKSKDQSIAEMNSLQSVTGDQVEQGVTYYSVMQKNLEVLKSALN